MELPKSDDDAPYEEQSNVIASPRKRKLSATNDFRNAENRSELGSGAPASDSSKWQKGIEGIPLQMSDKNHPASPPWIRIRSPSIEVISNPLSPLSSDTAPLIDNYAPSVDHDVQSGVEMPSRRVTDFGVNAPGVYSDALTIDACRRLLIEPRDRVSGLFLCKPNILAVSRHVPPTG
ncbi:uncharacterized protein EV420DRAFT_1485877 [Desarmillaria tabescens]|uniref:Uncharacterized protein n=1 Tax=Armillaria tabescens TaxID=1929756 RepID=A0AA39JEM5_ARMTA|nr:uncharacterized protein EV420DRAFT_1485877 [Desarmillaria tabescens]KAK0440667.1 hypothetical protein EV420DRAFT_1485877 [Desarmillaria tabescens]